MKISNKMQHAFTIVELLVVIVIIGILATLSIVSYSGISTKAITVSLMSDLDSGSKMLKLYNVDNGYYPSTIDSNYCPDTPTADNRYCLKASTGNELDYTGSGQTFTLTATNTDTGISYKVTEDGTITLVSDGSGGGGGGSEPKTFAMGWGGMEEDNSYSVALASDGGYVVVGYTYTYNAGNGDMFITKYDVNGNLSWSRRWGGTGWDGARSVAQTSDGGFVVTGDTTSYTAGRNDVFVVKYDADGNLLWNKTWGGVNWDYAFSVAKTSDGGCVVAGKSNSVGVNYDAFLIKYDSNGSVAWSKTWGGDANDAVYSVIQTSDGGYAVAGETSSFIANDSDAFLAKFDSDGNISWSRTLGGEFADAGYSVAQAADSGYVITGNVYNYGAGDNDMFLAKYDASGSLSWSKTWGGADGEYGKSVIRTSDDGYMVVGSTASYGAGGFDMYLAKYDASGVLSWSRTWGGSAYEAGLGVAQTSDGGYVAVGDNYSFAFGGSGDDAFIAKYDADGHMDNCPSSICNNITAETSTVTLLASSPTANNISFSLTTSSPTGAGEIIEALSTIIVPKDPWPAPTITFSSQELYVAYPGDDQTACKEWTAPDGKQVNGLYVNFATESEYDFFEISLDGSKKYSGSGVISNKYIDVSATPGSTLKACVVADSSTQDGFGGEVTGVYYK